MSSGFSTDGSLISASSVPHCGVLSLLSLPKYFVALLLDLLNVEWSPWRHSPLVRTRDPKLWEGDGGVQEEEEGGNCAEGYSVTTRTERRTDERKVAGSILGRSSGTIFPSPELASCSDSYFAVRSKRVLL